MASVLDSFVIQLGLDSSGLSHGTLVAQRSLRGMNDDVDKTGGKLEQAGEKGAKAFKTFRTEAMAAFALFTGGRSLEGFIKDTTEANTALGNLSRQLDIAPQKLNQLRYALQGAGASPTAAEAMFQALQAKSTDPREQARVRNVALTQAGIEVYDRNNHVRSDLVEQLHASERFNGLSRAMQDYVLSELGAQGIAPLLRSPQYDRLMTGTAGGGPSQSDIKTAEKLKADFAIFSKNTNDIQQMIYGDIAPSIDWFVEKLSSIEKANPKEIAHGLEAIGGSLFLLSGALTGLGIFKAIKGVKDLGKVLDILKKGGAVGEAATAGRGAGAAAAAERTGGRFLGMLGLGVAGRALPWVSALWPTPTASNDTISPESHQEVRIVQRTERHDNHVSVTHESAHVSVIHEPEIKHSKPQPIQLLGSQPPPLPQEPPRKDDTGYRGVTEKDEKDHRQPLSLDKVQNTLDRIYDTLKPFIGRQWERNSTDNTTREPWLPYTPDQTAQSGPDTPYLRAMPNDLQSLIGAMGMQESGGDPNARSKAGAEGLLQFMPSTAAGLHINPYDPIQAWHGAEEMVGRLLQKYGGDRDKTFAAYNWGEGHLDKAIRAMGDQWRRALPHETSDYIARVSDNLRTGHVLHLSDYDHRPTSSVTVGDVHVHTNGRDGHEIGRDVQAEIAKINRRGV